MVLAAPLFLIAQTRKAAEFYAINREPLLRMGLGTLAAWMGLRAISKSYEASKLSEEVELHAAKLQAVKAILSDANFVQTTAASSGFVAASSNSGAQANSKPASGWFSRATPEVADAAAQPASADEAAAKLSAALRSAFDDAVRSVDVRARANGSGTSGGASGGSSSGSPAWGALTSGRLPDLPLPQTDRIAQARSKAREMIEGGAFSGGSAGASAVPPSAAQVPAPAVSAPAPVPAPAPSPSTPAAAATPAPRRNLV